MDRPIFSCHVCKKLRFINDVGVVVTRYQNSKDPRYTFQENVRYCKDNPDCLEKAKQMRFNPLEDYEVQTVELID